MTDEQKLAIQFEIIKRYLIEHKNNVKEIEINKYHNILKQIEEIQKILLNSQTNLELLVTALKTECISNDNILEVLILSAVSAHPTFDIKLNCALIGDSDIGKSHIGNTCLDIVPKHLQYETTKVSPKVLYYQAIPNKDGYYYSFINKVIFLDDITENDTEILKNIANTSNTPPSFSTLINQKPYVIRLDASPVVWTTKVHLVEDDQGQVDRRFYTMEVKFDPKTILQIINKYKFNINSKKDVSWWRSANILNKVMKSPCTVIIPQKLDLKILNNNNTNAKFLIAMIRSITKINQCDKLDEKYLHILYSSDEDVKEAMRLFNTNRSQLNKLKDDAVSLLKYVTTSKPNVENDFDDKEINTVEHIFEMQKSILKINMNMVRKHLQSLEQKSLVCSIKGKFNRKYYYRP